MTGGNENILSTRDNQTNILAPDEDIASTENNETNIPVPEEIEYLDNYNAIKVYNPTHTNENEFIQVNTVLHPVAEQLESHMVTQESNFDKKDG